MNLLVTGGAGYIGSHTVQTLVNQGHKVTILDNLVFGHVQAFAHLEVKFVQGDLSDAALLAELFAQDAYDAVVHFAAFAYVGESVTDPLKYYQNNLGAPIVLLQAMQAAGIKQIVFSSTCATYGTPDAVPIAESQPQSPINPYGASKWMLERVLRDCEAAWGLRSVFLRYFNASGACLAGNLGEKHDPETHLIPLVLGAAAGTRPALTVFGQDYPTPDGTCIRDYIHVEDLADAHVAALHYLVSGGVTDAFNLGTGQGISILQIIEEAEAQTGLKVPVVFGPRREGDPAELVANANKAKEILGWTPKRSDLKTIIASAWNWHQNPKW